MSGITRQSEQYGIFDTPRPERDRRAAFEAPPEVIREYTRGPTVGAGQLNTRQAKKTWCPDCQAIVQDTHEHGDEDDEDSHTKESVNVRGMDPEEHAYHGEVLYGPTGIGDERRHYNPYSGYEPTDYDERMREAVGEDDESGYNWGPTPPHDPGSEPGPHPDFHGDVPHPFGTPIYNPGGGYSGHIPSFSAARRHTADGGPDDGDALGTHLFGGDDPDLFAYMFRPRSPSALSEMLGKTAGTLMPGSRVGLPYKGQVIRGIVTHLRPDAQVGVRWHDGQYSVENPGDVHLL